MKTQLKDGIWIEGFDVELLMLSNKYGLLSCLYEIIYSGETSEISEELAKKYADVVIHDESTDRERITGYFDYRVSEWRSIFASAKESIQSACPQEYCIIYKAK